eukprot:1055230-Rhodomonas_salina.1
MQKIRLPRILGYEGSYESRSKGSFREMSYGILRKCQNNSCYGLPLLQALVSTVKSIPTRHTLPANRTQKRVSLSFDFVVERRWTVTVPRGRRLLVNDLDQGVRGRDDWIAVSRPCKTVGAQCDVTATVTTSTQSFTGNLKILQVKFKFESFKLSSSSTKFKFELQTFTRRTCAPPASRLPAMIHGPLHFESNMF